MKKQNITILFDKQKDKSSGIIYVYECISCGKRFDKSTNDSNLDPHRDKNGNLCYGVGKFVEIKIQNNT